jgi:hypothetical protein
LKRSSLSGLIIKFTFVYGVVLCFHEQSDHHGKGIPQKNMEMFGAGQMNSQAVQQQPPVPPAKRTRLYVCTRQDQLRMVLERLSMPAVRRVIVVHPETSKVEGIISLSDVARFLFL